MVLITRGGLMCAGAERLDKIARWSDSPGSVKVTEDIKFEDDRVIRRSRV